MYKTLQVVLHKRETEQSVHMSNAGTSIDQRLRRQ